MGVEHSISGIQAPLNLQHTFRRRLEGPLLSFFRDRPTHNLSQGARALVEGQLGAWSLYTDGLIVDGTNEDAVKRLLEAKGTDPDLIARGKRSLVSVMPDREHRAGLIDIRRHSNPAIQEVLAGGDEDLLTEDGQALFYRVHAGDAPYLKPPLVQVDEETGERTLVLLWHNNPRLRKLIRKMREHKGGEVLLTGSSANITGQKQPTLLRELHPQIRERVDFTVDVRDGHTYRIPVNERDSIPMIDLTTEPPSIRRNGMYPALPKHPVLRKLLGS